MQAKIYYDGDCPFCTHYADYQRLQSTLESVELINLRDSPTERLELEALGYDLDQGMVVELDGNLLAGDDAVHHLALLGTDSSVLAKINRLILGNRAGARIAYPLLRLGRNATLLTAGRQPMAKDRPDEAAWQTLFFMAWGLFAYLHVMVYAYQFGATMWLTTWAIAPLGVALFLAPLSRRIFLLLVCLLIVDAWRQMPSLSNHTILKNVFLAGLLGSGAWHAVRGGKWQDFLSDAAPIGRASLVCMYIFGVFHKINSDFLNPEVSCAVVLWRAMPQYLSWIDADWFHLFSIYGTLVIETAILFCLLARKTRHAGIVLGIGFHGLLAMSGYALYAPFSTLTIALHLLFLDKESARQMIESPFWRTLMARLHTPRGLTALTLWLTAIALMAWLGMFSAIGVMWLLPIGLLCYAIARHGNAEPTSSDQTILWSKLWPLNLISLTFFLACFSPYLGLKTAQSMNMFANLRLEAGTSNHLILRAPPGPFNYLSDTVELTEASHSLYLGYIKHQGLHLTWYDLLDKLDRDPTAVVSYRRGGQAYEKQSAITLAADIQNTLHPRWARNFFHFNPVDLTTPKPCARDR